MTLLDALKDYASRLDGYRDMPEPIVDRDSSSILMNLPIGWPALKDPRSNTLFPYSLKVIVHHGDALTIDFGFGILLSPSRDMPISLEAFRNRLTQALRQSARLEAYPDIATSSPIMRIKEGVSLYDPSLCDYLYKCLDEATLIVQATHSPS